MNQYYHIMGRFLMIKIFIFFVSGVKFIIEKMYKNIVNVFFASPHFKLNFHMLRISSYHRFYHLSNHIIWQTGLSYHIISYHIILFHIISHHIISCHIISYYITSYRIISYHMISHHIISYHIISYNIASYHIMSCHVISYYITSYHIISHHIISYHTSLRIPTFTIIFLYAFQDLLMCTITARRIVSTGPGSRLPSH